MHVAAWRRLRHLARRDHEHEALTDAKLRASEVVRAPDRALRDAVFVGNRVDGVAASDAVNNASHFGSGKPYARAELFLRDGGGQLSVGVHQKGRARQNLSSLGNTVDAPQILFGHARLAGNVREGFAFFEVIENPA